MAGFPVSFNLYGKLQTFEKCCEANLDRKRKNKDLNKKIARRSRRVKPSTPCSLQSSGWAGCLSGTDFTDSENFMSHNIRFNFKQIKISAYVRYNTNYRVLRPEKNSINTHLELHYSLYEAFPLQRGLVVDHERLETKKKSRNSKCQVNSCLFTQQKHFKVTH